MGGAIDDRADEADENSRDRERPGRTGQRIAGKRRCREQRQAGAENNARLELLGTVFKPTVGNRHLPETVLSLLGAFLRTELHRHDKLYLIFRPPRGLSRPAERASGGERAGAQRQIEPAIFLVTDARNDSALAFGGICLRITFRQAAPPMTCGL